MKQNIKGRRKFLKNSGLALSLLSFDKNLLMANKYDIFGEDILRKLSLINDSKIEPLLLLQISEQNSRWNGGVKDVYQVPNHHRNDHLSRVYRCPRPHPTAHTPEAISSCCVYCPVQRLGSFRPPAG